MKKAKRYIKNLEFRFFQNFKKRYLTVVYLRGGEQHHFTYSNVPKNLKHDEKSVRKFINK